MYGFGLAQQKKSNNVDSTLRVLYQVLPVVPYIFRPLGLEGLRYYEVNPTVSAWRVLHADVNFTGYNIHSVVYRH